MRKSIEQLHKKVKGANAKIMRNTVASLLCVAAIAGLSIWNPTIAPVLLNVACTCLSLGFCGGIMGIAKGVSTRKYVLEDETWTKTKLSYRKYRKLEKTGELVNWLNRESGYEFYSEIDKTTSKTEGAALSPEDAEYLRVAINKQSTSNVETLESNNTESEKQTDEEREI